ncbi:MAG: bifunctional isocitrate dehydrogenase kinase/phosphatase [Acidobacteriota bacterium]|nr:bifunctional isocitrate dehydrogenase kinase/phosphatase [Acidobacteriota bacterium]
MTFSVPPERAADTILRGFDDHHDRFRAMTRRARKRFEQRDWEGIRWDTIKRLELYDQCIVETIAALREQLQESFEDRDAWAPIKLAFTNAILGRNDFELAETYFNSLTRKIFPHVGVDPRIDYVSHDFPLPFRGWEMASARMYGVRRVDEMLIRKILEDADFRVPFHDLPGDARRVADRVEQIITEIFGHHEIDAVDVLEPVFIRNKAAYVVGRIRRGDTLLPMVLAILNPEEGLEVDAVLSSEEDTSILFSFARWYLHADLASPREVIGFLHSILPRKRVSELYISLGYNKHGKSEFFADLIATIDSLDEQFVVAPGKPGLVMSVFTLPSFEFVFKVIKDIFPPSKSTTREEIRAKYRQVLLHDRVGRLVDYQVFENVKFPRQRFGEELLHELLDVAGKAVVLDGNDVVIHHMYVGRRVTPLDVFLPTAGAEEAEAAILDWGQTLKDLAAANIFAGDILLKNFGLTRHRRVVFYDYDEVSLISTRNFRRFPKPRNEFDEMASEPWFSVAKEDVFPEEFNSFLGFGGDLREAFERTHGDLAGIDFWKDTQERIQAGELIEFHPYRERLRLGRG